MKKPFKATDKQKDLINFILINEAELPKKKIKNLLKDAIDGKLTGYECVRGEGAKPNVTFIYDGLKNN